MIFTKCFNHTVKTKEEFLELFLLTICSFIIVSNIIMLSNDGGWLLPTHKATNTVKE